MCGRYSLSAPSSQVIEQFELFAEESYIKSVYEPMGEIYPTRKAPILIEKEGSLHLTYLQWGIPSSKKTIINARTDSLFTSKMWQKVWKEGRCLVPANHFFEWKGESPKSRERFTIAPCPDQGLWSFAGLVFEGSFVIITEASNSKMMQIHHRQPAIIEKANRTKWISKNEINPESLIHAFGSEEMTLSDNFLFS